MPFTYANEQNVLNHLTGKSPWPFPASGVYIGLSTSTPTKAGGNVTEPGSGGYARVLVSPSDWAAVANGATTLANSKSFPAATGNWSSLVPQAFLVIYDQATGGTLLAYKQLAATRIVSTGQIVRIPINDLDISFFTDSATPPAPAVPANLQAQTVSTTQINLSWNAVMAGQWPATYRLYRNSTLIQTLSTTTFSDTGLAAATTYNYQIRAVNILGVASALSSVVQGTTQSGSSGLTEDQDLAYRISLPGLIRYMPLDTQAGVFDQNIAGQRQYFEEPSGAPRFGPHTNDIGVPGPFTHGLFSQIFARIDTTIKAAGAGSLQFRTPSRSSQGVAGAVRFNWTDLFTNAVEREAKYTQAGEKVFVQFRYRLNEAMAFAFNYRPDHQPGKSGHKVAIMGFGDISVGPPINTDQNAQSTSHSAIEFVCQSQPNIQGAGAMRGGPAGYHQHNTANSDIVDDVDSAHGINTADRYQNAIGYPNGPYCLYQPSGTVGAPCMPFVAGEWMTIMMVIISGSYTPSPGSTANTRFLTYFAYKDQPYQCVADSWVASADGHPYGAIAVTDPQEANCRVGKIWFLPYISFKDPAEVHPDADCWYANAIVSKNFLPEPGTSARCSLAETARQLAVGSWNLMHHEGTASERGLNIALMTTMPGSNPPVDVITEYGDKAVWNELDHEIHYMGQSHPHSQQAKHIRYKARANSGAGQWELVGSLPWTPVSSQGNTPNHGYKHAAIYPVNGDVYQKDYGESKTMCRWRRAGGVYAAPLGSWPSGNWESAGFLEWFPQLQRFVVASAYDGDRHFEWDPVTQTGQAFIFSFPPNQGLGGNPGAGIPPYFVSGSIGIYNPITEAMYIGGNAGKLKELTKARVWSDIAVSPCTINNGTIGNGGWGGSAGQALSVIDPVTGNLLAFYWDVNSDTGQLWEYTRGTNSWARRTDREAAIPFFSMSIAQLKHEGTFSVAAVPIDCYGVIGFIVGRPAAIGSRFYIYKHA